MADPVQVIFVDDDTIVHPLLTKVLELAGIKVLACCKSAEELLAMQNTPRYQDAQLFMFDVQMPRMTGVELAAKLRADGEKRPILVTSAYAVDFSWGLREMQVEYLQKPYDFAALENKIKNLAYHSYCLGGHC